MSHFLHVWKHLRNYVSGVWLPENPETKSLETAAVLSLGNMIQDLDKSVRYSQHDLQKNAEYHQKPSPVVASNNRWYGYSNSKPNSRSAMRLWGCLIVAT